MRLKRGTREVGFWWDNVGSKGASSGVALRSGVWSLVVVTGPTVIAAASVSTETKIVYLANPNNPTGTMFSQSRFEAFMDQIPKEVLVILDEAYCAYASKHDGYPDGLQYSHENLIIARSLSKVYGLAGLRIGFAGLPGLGGRARGGSRVGQLVLGLLVELVDLG